MTASGSFPFGGIWRSSPSYFSDLSSVPSAGLPGTIAGPVSPPFSSPAFVSSFSPPLSFFCPSPASAEWHL